MKNKWQVTYWNWDKDVLETRSFSSYEEAITYQNKIIKKYNSNNVKINLKGENK